MEEQFKTFGLELTAMVEEAAKVAGVDVEFVTRVGHPAEKILDFAEKKSVDMIVVGSLEKPMSNAFFLAAYPKRSSGMQKFRYLSCMGKGIERRGNSRAAGKELKKLMF